jgi:hypothetical protein
LLLPDFSFQFNEVLDKLYRKDFLAEVMGSYLNGFAGLWVEGFQGLFQRTHLLFRGVSDASVIKSDSQEL